jgi:nucleoside-diphosphate-sugar epimerase
MKILIVGGTGLIGGHAALHLTELGNQVSIAARKPAPEATPMAKLPFIQGDYLTDDFALKNLRGFDALIFAAGNDIRHLPPDTDEAEHWQRANAKGVPAFFRKARDAGIGTAILIGSFYPQAAPHTVEKSSYVRGRKLADDGARALNSKEFRVCSLNAPFVAGVVPGLVVPGFAAHVNYALGRIPQIPPFAMPGGVNFMSTNSLSEAVAGALVRGEPGKAYLLGDENLSFAEYFGEFFRAAGREEPLEVIDREHPLLPDAVLYAGRGSTIYYEPNPEEVELLGYRRNDVRRVLKEIAKTYG